MSEYSKEIEVLNKIEIAVKNDAKEFDGKPFNGQTVAQYLGYQGAAIAALANILRSILDRNGPWIERSNYEP